jgi:hypothetical protein
MARKPTPIRLLVAHENPRVDKGAIGTLESGPKKGVVTLIFRPRLGTTIRIKVPESHAEVVR